MPPVKPSFKAKLARSSFLPTNFVAGASLGLHVRGAAPFMGDRRHSPSILQGAKYRFGRQPPAADPAVMKEFRKFVKTWLHKNMIPLPSGSDVSVETWLAHAPYPEWRKEQLRKVAKDGVEVISRHDLICKGFAKGEPMEKAKPERCICARKDKCKVKIGPWIHLIDKVFFMRPETIKTIPVRDRAKYLHKLMFVVGGKYLETDYTSYESLFTRQLMAATELQLYEYMWSRMPKGREMFKFVRKMIATTNRIKFPGLLVKLEATRMSGEMCTSLGNSFCNLMAMYFTCHQLGSSCVGVIEGDDGLFRVDGPSPTAEDFARMGLRIKLEVRDTLPEASFCSMIYDPSVYENLVDPAWLLVKFGWTMSDQRFSKQSVLRGLLRAKGLSLLYELPGCPIARSLGQAALRLTKGCELQIEALGGVRDWWTTQVMNGTDGVTLNPEILERLSRPITQTSREIVERLFGVPINAQLTIERYLDGLNEIQALDHPAIAMIMLDTWKENWDLYSLRTATSL